MTGRRSNKLVVALVLCATCWMVAWPARCFIPQRHVVSNLRRVKIIRQAEDAEQGSQPLPELPMGVDDFATVRETNCAYADKTGLLPGMVVFPRQHFLARPRRFGKTLLLDTIKCVFMENGDKKDAIFGGLDITNSDEGKELLKLELPVVFLKLNGCEATEGKKTLINDINELLIEEAERNGVYGVQPAEGSVGTTLSRVIRAIRLKCNNKKVVLLVDEYDAPITQVLEANGGNVDERVNRNLEVLRTLFTKAKSIASSDFHYSLYAGVSDFVSTSLFSSANQLRDITFVPDWASIVGFTEKEVNTYFTGYVGVLATFNVTLEEVARQYGGYRFTFPAEQLFNPWALLNRFNQTSCGEAQLDMWGAQTPGWPRKMLDEGKIPEVLKVLATWKPLADFRGISVDSLEQLSTSDRVTLLQQTGYLTIREMKAMASKPQVRLAVPNQGVRDAFWRPALNVADESEGNQLLIELFEALQRGSFENVTDAVNKLTKLAPWATPAAKAREVLQTLSEWFSQLR